jgi:Bifunctional DNA primase/polymerase, N-terminal
VDAIRANLRAWTLHFAALGWHVSPIIPGGKKPPVVDRWETRASTDPDHINHWWQHAYTIGIATGPSGLAIIDLDTPKPGEPVPEPVGHPRDDHRRHHPCRFHRRTST